MKNDTEERPATHANPEDWPEDAAHENGNYQNRCCECHRLFLGHKRRVVCRICVKEKEAKSAELRAARGLPSEEPNTAASAPSSPDNASLAEKPTHDSGNGVSEAPRNIDATAHRSWWERTRYAPSPFDTWFAALAWERNRVAQMVDTSARDAVDRAEEQLAKVRVLSDTPRTDEFIEVPISKDADGEDDWIANARQWAEFARQLERELAAVTAERDSWRRQLEQLRAVRDAAEVLLRDYSMSPSPHELRTMIAASRATAG